MSAIGAVMSQPPFNVQQPPPATRPVDKDGDHDNGAKETGAAETREAVPSGSPGVNIIA